MTKGKGPNNRIMVRLDDETEWGLAQLAKKQKVTVAEAARLAIKQVVFDDTTRKIADLLAEIDRRLLVTATTEQMEKLSAQFVMLAETNNTNVNRLAAALNKFFERGK